MKKIFTLLILSAVVMVVILYAAMAHAITATQTGTDITIGYDEPTTNEDESALDDLSHCTITNSFDAQSIDVPATALTGGGIGVTQVISLAIVAGQQHDVTFNVVACDMSGNCSVPATTTVRIDRLAPAQVQ